MAFFGGDHVLFEAALESSVFVVELRTLAASCNPWMQAGGTPCSMGITRGTRGTLGNTISLFGAYVCLANSRRTMYSGLGGGVRKMRVLARVASRRVRRNIHIYMLPLLLLLLLC